MFKEELIAYVQRRPFCPFEIWTTGGFIIRVLRSDDIYLSMGSLTVIIADVDGSEIVIESDKIEALKLFPYSRNRTR